MESVFRYLTMAVSRSQATNLGQAFAESEARTAGYDPATAEANAHQPEEEPMPEDEGKQADGTGEQKKGFFSRFFNRSASGPTAAATSAQNTAASPPSAMGPTSPTPARTASTAGGRGAASQDVNLGQRPEKLSVADFDLLKVVGKGAFGKVMLVRKKTGVGEGQIFAMKVLKKAVIAAKGQVEHTKSERSILCEIRHPFIVRLRFAFQSEDKLYLVTDYYNGGSLFYHLRKSRSFSEERARFYAAELLTALDHLHQQSIVYRDLKLENVLMDSQGHIALTDFGLSKQNIDSTEGATTFCGTAEYIAPELLKGQRYGPAVDWWSFGILLYEMMAGRTPFYDKNRKLMFYKIINTAPQFPPHFSPEACTVLRALLNINPESRLGTVEGGNAAQDIMNSDFFRVIDFDALLNKSIEPPFTPEVQNELDTKYVPKAYLQTEAKDSMVEKKKGDVVAAFEQFTYLGDSAMGGGEA
jgi:serine/threonine protein kinase